MATMPDNNYIDQLKALASEASCQIIGVLAAHKPTPVPVHVISEQLEMKRTTASTYLRRLRNARLVHIQDRRKGYFADSEEIKAIVGPKIYARITQDLRAQNEDMPRQS